MKIQININGKALRLVLSRRWLVALALVAMLGTVFAATVTKPHADFTSGTVISSSAVNDNFDMLYSALSNQMYGVTVYGTDGNVGIRHNTPTSRLHIADRGISSSYDSKSGMINAVTAGGNSLLFGHNNGGYTCSLGAFSGSGVPFLSFFSYHDAKVANQLLRSGTQMPGMISYAFDSGSYVFQTAAAGTADSVISSLNTSMIITPSGVGIMAGNNGYGLYVNGSLAVNSGTTLKTGTLSWTTLSDGRLKDVGSEYSAGLDEVMRLKPVHFRYKKDNPLKASSKEQYIGFVAQDVQKVIPEAVSKMKDGYLRLQADPIFWAMLNSIKQLKNENDTLKARLGSLEKRLAALERKSVW